MRLIHPIYLDVPMLVSFAAALEGGLSFGAEVTRQSSSSQDRTADVSASFGLSKLFSSLFSVSADVGTTGSKSEGEQETHRESKSHTEASIAIMLYDRLRSAGSDYLVQPTTNEDLEKVTPGALVELSGTIHKNAVDQLIDYFDTTNILSQLAATEQKGQASKRSRAQSSPLQHARERLDADRKRTPISNVTLDCTVPRGAKAVITLRTENLRDLTMSELHKNDVRVVGKVTRILPAGETMNAFENYGLALFEPGFLDEIFSDMTNNENMVVEFSDLRIEGPAVQVLPLMVFV